jgi:hypothetical protein
MVDGLQITQNGTKTPLAITLSETGRALRGKTMRQWR